jgi:hypothetical protein
VRNSLIASVESAAATISSSAASTSRHEFR